MKIFYLVDTLYKSGGLEHILSAKANALAEDFGYQVFIVTNHQKGRKDFFPLSPEVHHIDLGVNYRIPFLMPRYVRKLNGLIAEEKPDIVISTCGRELGQMSKLSGSFIRMAEFHFSKEMYVVKGQKERIAEMEKAIGCLDCFVTLTKEDMSAWKGACKRIEQIYNPSFIDHDVQPSALSEKRCIAAGRFVKQKNFKDLILAWKQVHEKFPDWELDIFGDGPLKKECQELAGSLGLLATVHLHPATRRIGERMRESSLFVMSSIYEGFPLVMIEAASLGLPFVGYRCPCGPGEFIEDGKDGFTVDPGDVDALAERICRCLSDRDQLRVMGDHIFRKAQEFSVPSIMKEWDRLFRSLSQA